MLSNYSFRHIGSKNIHLVFSLLLFFTFAIFDFTACADNEKIPVKLEVVGEQKIQSQVADFIKEYLKKLADIQIVEDSPKVYVHIIVRRLITNRGRKLGYVISAASSEIIEMYVDGKYPYTVSDYNGLWMETGPDIRNLCFQCVTALNSGVFDMIRNTQADDIEIHSMQ